ncbi:MAG: T9SS type A sorting domain-containing protein [Bacteroidales bacterium]
MKRNLLFACMATCIGSVSMNAENQTPSSFLFQNYPVGAFEISAAGPGANPTGLLDTPGHTVVACGPAVADQFLPALRECASIVSSKWGNLLMIKGKDSSVSEGIAASSSLNTGWWNFNFIGPKSTVAQTYRGTIQMKLITDMAPNEEKVVKVNYVTGGGNNVSLGTRETLYLGDEGWFQTQIQGTIGTTDAARLRIELPAGMMDQSALYIYEVRFEKNPTEELFNSPNDGTPGADKPYGAIETSLNGVGAHSESFVTWETGKIYINQAADKQVSVYAISGQKVKDFVATENLVELSMNTGVYVVKIDNQITKVVL